MTTDPDPVPPVDTTTYRQKAEVALEHAADADKSLSSIAYAVEGIGWALLANGQDAEVFYSLFHGEGDKANIEAWVSKD